jgi:hypothetical protein
MTLSVPQKGANTLKANVITLGSSLDVWLESSKSLISRKGENFSKFLPKGAGLKIVEMRFQNFRAVSFATKGARSHYWVTKTGNSAPSRRIQASPSRMTNRSMKFCSKCSIAGMPTTSRGIWMCTGNRPNYWLSSALSSLTAGSNFTILTFTGIRVVPRWGSSDPDASKSGC